jgi:hypothetical protein
MRGVATGLLVLGESTSQKGNLNPSWPLFANELTQAGRLGTRGSFKIFEKATQRQLTLQKRGPREKIVTDRRQSELTLDP